MRRSGKLVRDSIPELLEKRGVSFSVRKLNSAEFRRALKEKLVEEAREVVEASSRKDLMEECADVTEVLNALQKAYGISKEELTVVRRKKRKERGGFENRLFLKLSP